MMGTQEIEVSEKAGSIQLEIDESKDSKHCLVLAHGAGAGMDHPFMKSLAKGICAHGIHVIRFNFPYKQKGKKMPGSPRESILAIEKVALFAKDKFPDCSIVLSGKSYGGRMSSHVVAEQPGLGIKGLVYFGFPLHAPGKASTDRANHLKTIEIPQLFLQGTNDALANYEMIQAVVAEQKKTDLVAFELADHSFKTPKTAPMKTSEVFKQLVDRAAQWIMGLS
ncbi:MAG: dienelactone hydrolase family protein [Cyclobacteriaceae bacterium]|jgi:predicted alpha/beta-hydrolase family hydrolase